MGVPTVHLHDLEQCRQSLGMHVPPLQWCTSSSEVSEALEVDQAARSTARWSASS